MMTGSGGYQGGDVPTADAARRGGSEVVATDEGPSPLVESFAAMVKSLDADARQLTRLLSLLPVVEATASAPPQPPTEAGEDRETSLNRRLGADLASLQPAVTQLEHRMDGLRRALLDEQNSLQQLKALVPFVEQQQHDLDYMHKALPQHLPGDNAVAAAATAATTTTAATAPATQRARARSRDSRPVRGKAAEYNEGSASASTSGGGGGGRQRETRPSSTMDHTAASTDKAGRGVLHLVTAAELESVPKTTRGRLQLEQVNGIVSEVQVMLDDKYALLALSKARPRRTLNDNEKKFVENAKRLVTKEHAGERFLTELEWRQSKTLKGIGGATSKAFFVTLRHLRRIRAVRVSGGVMTYAVVEG